MNNTHTRRGKTQNNWVGQVLPDNAPAKGHPSTFISGSNHFNCQVEPDLHKTTTPSSVLTGHLPPHGEAANFNAPSTWRERVGVARMRGLSLFNLVNPSPALRASSPARGEEEQHHGFTLIELLVVVLIIGILAAVALPQYQFAVDKARVAPYVQQTYNFLNAQQLYFLENGEYAANASDLAIGIFSHCTKRNCSEFSNCENHFSFNIPSGRIDNKCRFHETSPTLSFTYCAQNSTDCRVNGNKDMRLSFSLNTGKLLSCSYWTTRGQKLCKWLKPE